ncbi:nuclear transport factor 2 family protein [Pedobacter frigoris]|uniref:Nuclear transport factor 2 family protein n=1 Tax=Pedobacter frigoris TaxID=2571272 RepID=A0A4V5NZ63_9SPHI|nr:nuclear transport factor 2 family protein [Pedobacter frigoris]TKC05823.1 nuclear transport factor 2 family protein [Pedobacter frigoris]
MKRTILIASLAFLSVGNAFAQQKQIGNDNKETTMVMINEIQNKQRANAELYFRKVDAGEFDGGYYNLFTEDVELYFPKFGFSKGKEGIKQFGVAMSGFLQGLTHDIENFNYIVSNNTVVVEGTEKGITIDGKPWPDNVTTFGKFCNVFEFEGDLIKRVHIYVDPDVTSEDVVRMARLNQDHKEKDVNLIERDTRTVVEEFYEIQSGKKEGGLAELFADKVDFDLAGNEEKFPWVGKRHTKKEVEDYFKVLYQNIKSEKFDVEFISINGEDAVAVGQLSSVILKYDKVFNAQFVNIFKVRNGKIIKYHFMEDSYRLNEEMK